MALRLTVVALFMALSGGCATTQVVHLDTGLDVPSEYRPPISDKSGKMDAHAFEEALMHWVVTATLMMKSSKELGDFLEGLGANWLVIERFAEDFKAEGLSGSAAFTLSR
jgi:hypothetical protein